jgi:hypothetical protein
VKLGNLEKMAVNVLGFFSKWTGLQFVKFLKTKIIVWISEKLAAAKSSEKISEI